MKSCRMPESGNRTTCMAKMIRLAAAAAAVLEAVASVAAASVAAASADSVTRSRCSHRCLAAAIRSQKCLAAGGLAAWVRHSDSAFGAEAHVCYVCLYAYACACVRAWVCTLTDCSLVPHKHTRAAVAGCHQHCLLSASRECAPTWLCPPALDPCTRAARAGGHQHQHQHHHANQHQHQHQPPFGGGFGAMGMMGGMGGMGGDPFGGGGTFMSMSSSSGGFGGGGGGGSFTSSSSSTTVRNGKRITTKRCTCP